MNGFPGPPASAWQEHHTPDGRAYYYNASTKVTQWTKPEDMMSPAERALANQPWKEYTAEGGRKYWYNTETKQSSWEMPDVFKNALGTPESRNSFTAPAAHSQGHGGGSRHGYRDQGRGMRDSRDSLPENRQLSRSFVPAVESGPEYATKEEAVAAFTKALRRHGVQHDWTWEQALKTAAKDPQFRAIKQPKARREAFVKYCQDMVLHEQERAKERLAKLRADFETMLKRHPEITHITRWKTARPMIEGETHFRSTDDESERQQLFSEYVAELKKNNKETQIAQRKAALDGLKELLPKLHINAYTRWDDGSQIISAATQSDPKYQVLVMSDILTKFQDHIKSLERALNEKKQHDKKMQFRRERQNRDVFKGLLAELRRDGHIKAGSKWSQVCRLMENDERYLNMLGQDGPTPLLLFWDMVEEEERALRGPRNDVLDVLEDKRFDLTPNTTPEEFMSVMREDRRTANIDQALLQLIFERLREKRAAKREDDRHPDRHQRHALDNLRSHMKRLEPPIVMDDSWESVRPRVAKSAEFQAVGSEDSARHAFDRHMRRLKDKADEEPERGNRRDSRVSSERDLSHRNRERSRGDRSHRGRRPSRRSRSPEPDPYEADRRRAGAERERNHRKSAMAENVLSAGDRARLSPPPPPRRERDRDHRERDRDYDRYSRPRRSEDAPYGRERRDREDDRERSFRRPIDARSVDELNYGDERPPTSTVSRRRRPDDEEGLSRKDTRDSKRIKRDTSRERTPKREARSRVKSSPAVTKEVRGVRSGSEEGEIEE
ncbi:FF domain-containing protein [Hirsutella rhossiliensis]|uniref:FF domain-containing protein n=1 Tax=Hirsutella rhossiliensis TaxID=111463 RepID=A0A9P8SJN3_9HYPO|nr:FF domain-containing protein [Hirsutella rhossiliensis]KAH0963216.1 FF domain-containing protein [Hirsutella rhossiliensis]